MQPNKKVLGVKRIGLILSVLFLFFLLFLGCTTDKTYVLKNDTNVYIDLNADLVKQTIKLNDLNDVTAPYCSTKQFLGCDSITGGWIPITIFDPVDDDTNYRTWDNNTFTNAIVTNDLNVVRDLRVDGNVFVNNIYGGDWNKLDGGFEVVDLVTPNVYVRATRRTGFNLNGVSVSDGNLVVSVGGMYLVITSSSVQALGSEFGMKGFVNDTGMNNCYAHFHTQVNSTSNPNFNCLVRMVAGQNFNVRFDDHSNPVNDLILESMNVIILRVGN